MANSDPGTKDSSESRERAAPDEDEEGLRRAVEEKYDFDNFTPRDMAEMSPEEWDAAFDADSWITGRELLDRVEADVGHRIATGEVFGVVERERVDGEERLVVYSDEGYAFVYGDGSVEGRGTVYRDVQPSVALCSMESYDVPDTPADVDLPDPESVREAGGELGNQVVQVVAGLQVGAGVLLLLAPVIFDPIIRAMCTPAAGGAYACTVGPLSGELYPFGQSAILSTFAGLGFLLFGLFLFIVVANARLSNRFRSEEYRNRLRAAGVDSGERPAFVPGEDDEDDR